MYNKGRKEEGRGRKKKESRRERKREGERSDGFGREERVTDLESGKGKKTCFVGARGNVFFWLNSKLTNYVVDGGY